MHRNLKRTFGSHAGSWSVSDFQALEHEARRRSVRFHERRFSFHRYSGFRFRYGDRLNGGSHRPDLLRTGLGLEQAAEREPIVFFLIALFVRLGTEFPAARETFEERQFFSAIQASHRPLIGSYGG
jgi:hypothetical protein